MEFWFSVALLLVLGWPLARAVARSTELFVLEVREGELHFVRGRIPPVLLEELRDVGRHGSLRDGRIRVLREQDSARVEAPSLDPGTLQQVRNVVGTYPLVKILTGSLRR